ncbi:MAG: tRNA uridine-5-carboxymethylaminomethyl(34) synthesis GTPase MnmE, partial [Clostridia bacterium]|nr:tRNA uridine-5-carboxymethylaminomethyl(34) synthesis GTPase MnmE [Clostridia bacterium]
MNLERDTIAAISTPPGAGAIGILRLSGPRAATIAQKCFKPLSPKGLTDHAPRTLVYGDLLDREGFPIDRVLCTYSRGPASYTGEDTAEFHCHGSPMVLSLGLEALFHAGARQATAGEFTRRAFLNGRLDLAQAEAVGDLLESRSRESARHAAGQLSGALSR